MKRTMINTAALLLVSVLVIPLWVGQARAGDTWLDANGIRTDNVTLNGIHVTNSTYWIDPPFLSSKVAPNVMFLLDNSGSMNCAAYPGNYDPTKFASGDYFGYYDPHSMYRYNGTKWQKTTASPSTATVDNPIASGNLLNWAAMRRIDVAKRLLNGGKANPRSPSAGQTVALVGEVPNNGAYCSNDQLIGQFNNAFAVPASHLPSGYANVIYPFHGNYTYTLTKNGLEVTPPPAANPYAFPNANVDVAASWSVHPSTYQAYQAIYELYTDWDWSYIATSTVNEPAMFDYKYTGGTGGTISKISVAMTLRKTSSKNNDKMSIQGGIRVNGIDYFGTAASIKDKYSNQDPIFFDWATNPATGQPWQWSDIKTNGPGSLEAIGVQLATNSNTADELRVTRMYLLITVAAPSGGPYNIVIDTGKTTADTGIIGQLSSDARFGLAFYNSDAQGAEVQTEVDFGTPVNMITAVDNEKATTNTPLAESLYTLVRYYRQDPPMYHNNDYQTGSFTANDPYYYAYSKVAGSGLNDQYVPCAKSFILLLTDGEPTGDNTWCTGSGASQICAPTETQDSDGNGSRLDNIALWARTNDMRPGSCTTSGSPWPCVTDDQRIYTYPVFMFGQGSSLMMNAAIKGGFDDLDGDNWPSCLDSTGHLKTNATQDELKECYRDSNGNGSIDPYDATTNPHGDFPLTYYQGDDGYELQAGIIDAISAILKRAASGTSVSVLGASWKGEGAIYQAYFYPEKVEGLRRLKWTGYFASLFVDRNGLIHEDTNGDGKLTPADDYVVQFYFTSGNDTKIQYFKDEKNNTTGELVPDGILDTTVPIKTIAITDVKPVWDAGKMLAYRDPADRTIYTSVDADTASPPSLISFDDSNASSLRPFIRGKTDSDAANLINFIRGAQIPGWRDRQMTVDGALRTWKLGDIVFSDPVVVPAPKERFDNIYEDNSYRTFYNAYYKRRAVVLVGSNDGMLHAFNGGYSISTETPNPGASEAQVTFCTSLDPSDSTKCGTDPSAPPLGKELWAFVPFDVLPHLAWLADPDYQHVYYVDQLTRVTDARIFTADADHPGGWGTVAIIGLRFGGPEIDVTDTFSGADTTKQFKSAYYALDITNPENPPKLLWRFTDNELGFSLSVPAIVREEDAGIDHWYAVFGSGPSNYRGGRAVDATITNTKFTKDGVGGLSGMATTNPYLFIVDLATGKADPAWSVDTSSGRRGVMRGGLTAAYFGNPTVVDYPLDAKYDMIYVGNIFCSSGCGTDGVGTWGGKMIRINTRDATNPAQWSPSLLFEAGNALLAKPSVSIDDAKHIWVYFGTGRFLHIDDRFDTSQQNFYGIKDPCYTGKAALWCTTTVANSTNLLNSNSLTVNTDGTLTPPLAANALGSNIPKSQTTTFDDLVTVMRDSAAGWKIALGTGERVNVNGFVVGGIAGFGTYTPTNDVCEFEGTSRQYFPYYLTGTVPYSPGGTFLNSVYVETGGGLPSAPAVHIDQFGNVRLFIQKSTGQIVVVNMRSASVVPGGFGPSRECTN